MLNCSGINQPSIVISNCQKSVSKLAQIHYGTSLKIYWHLFKFQRWEPVREFYPTHSTFHHFHLKENLCKSSIMWFQLVPSWVVSSLYFSEAKFSKDVRKTNVFWFSNTMLNLTDLFIYSCLIQIYLFLNNSDLFILD